MSEVRTDFTGDASSLERAASTAQSSIKGFLESADKTAATLAQMNQVVELGTKAFRAAAGASGAAGVAFAAVALTIGATYAAYKVYNAEAERAGALLNIHKAGLKAIQPLLDDQWETEMDLAAALQGGNDELSTRIAGYKELQGVLDPTKKRLTELHEEQTSFTQQMKDGLVSLTAYSAEFQGGWNPVANAAAYYTGALVDTSSDLQNQIDVTMGSVVLATAAEEELIDTKIKLNKTIKTQKDELQRLNAEMTEQARLMKEDEAAADLQIQQNEDHLDRLHEFRKNEREAEQAASEERIQAAKDEAEELDRVSKEARDQKISDQQAVGAATIALGESLLDATTKQYDTTTQAGREAAKKQFATQKAVKLAMAVVAGALAVQESLASGPPPANFILAAVTGAAAAVEVGVIAAAQPAFHSGKSPDEINATILRQEAVMNPTATANMGRREVEQRNAGMTPSRGGYSGPAPIIIGHKVMNESIKRELQTYGVLTQALAQSRNIGVRTNRRGE